MSIRRFLTEKGPKAVGPYCTAAEVGGMVYLSGMLGIDPAAGKLREGGTLSQAEQMFENVRTVLGEMGLSMENVVKTTVFLTDLDDFAAVNQLYGQAFVDGFPARSCVQVSRLPLGASVEMECVAARA